MNPTVLSNDQMNDETSEKGGGRGLIQVPSVEREQDICMIMKCLPTDYLLVVKERNNYALEKPHLDQVVRMSTTEQTDVACP